MHFQLLAYVQPSSMPRMRAGRGGPRDHKSERRTLLVAWRRHATGRAVEQRMVTLTGRDHGTRLDLYKPLVLKQ